MVRTVVKALVLAFIVGHALTDGRAFAQDARPYEATAPQRQLPTLEAGGTGFFPFLDSVYDGGGLTLGAGYRRFFAPRAEWDIKGLYSLRHYKFFEVSTTSAGHEGGRLIVRGRVGWRDATEVGFYGVGMAPLEDARANFRLQQAYAGGSVIWRATDRVAAGGAVDFEDFTMRPGLGDVPPIETLYSPLTAPGLGTSPAYVHSILTGAYDTRDRPGVATRGGYYGASLHSYVGAADADSFSRLDVQTLHHVPIRDRWIVSARARLQTTLGGGGAVPYFLLPSVGSGGSLRASPPARFRGLHAVLGTLEGRWLYREWTIDFLRSPVGLELATFYDLGQVAFDRSHLFDDLEDDLGIGVRVHWRNTTPVRVDLAKGSEGWRVVFSGSAPF
jgi:hypothetical protein